MSQYSSKTLTGLEPALGGAGTDRLSGSEPLLGGSRRIEVDIKRVYALITTDIEAEREEALAFIRRLGQSVLYARELIQIIPPYARQKIANWRGSFTLTQRRRAIDALGNLGGAESLAVLLDSMSDANYEIRNTAHDALQQIGQRLNLAELKTSGGLKALIKTLGSSSLSARKIAADLLAAAPPDTVLGALLMDGLTAEEWSARREAAWVLGRLGDRRAVAKLVDTLDDVSPAVRVAAAWALGRLDAPVAIPYLINRLTDPDEAARAAAVTALGDQTARHAALDPSHQRVIDLLVDVVSIDKEASVRHAALDALAAIHTPEARSALAKLLKQ